MLLAVEYGEQDISNTGKRNPTAGFASLGVAQVDQMQTTPAAGD
jgi:hypothetical protein